MVSPLRFARVMIGGFRLRRADCCSNLPLTFCCRNLSLLEVFLLDKIDHKLTFLCSLKSWIMILCTFDDVIASSCHHFLPSVLSIVSPWYNRNGWLGVKHQVTYLLTFPLSNAFSWLYIRSHWLPMQRQVLSYIILVLNILSVEAFNMQSEMFRLSSLCPINVTIPDSCI